MKQPNSIESARMAEVEDINSLWRTWELTAHFAIIADVCRTRRRSPLFVFHPVSDCITKKVLHLGVQAAAFLLRPASQALPQVR